MSYQEKQPRVVGLDEKVPAFKFPLKPWHDYSLHLSMNPGVYSPLLLKSGFLPDLRFFSVAQQEEPGDTVGKFWIEADKNQLGKLGWLKLAPIGLPLPMPPAIYGAPEWDGHYIFDRAVLEKIGKLEVHLFTPEDEYTSRPNIYHILNRRVLYTTGIEFDQYREIRELPKKEVSIPVDLRDESYLRSMMVMFTIS